MAPRADAGSSHRLARATRALNDGIAEYVGRHPDRLVALGGVPMADGNEAAKELERCMKQLKFKGVEILTNVAGKELSDPAFAPFWKKAEELQAFIFIHPQTAPQSTGIAKRLVIDWRLSPRSANLRPAIVIKGKDGKPAKISTGADARYLLPVDAILSVDQGATINAGDIVARISIDSAKTRDITGGLPRVAELFEARRPKDHAIIAEIAGTIQFRVNVKMFQRRVPSASRPEAATAAACAASTAGIAIAGMA